MSISYSSFHNAVFMLRCIRDFAELKGWLKLKVSLIKEPV